MNRLLFPALLLAATLVICGCEPTLDGPGGDRRGAGFRPPAREPRNSDRSVERDAEPDAAPDRNTVESRPEVQPEPAPPPAPVQPTAPAGGYEYGKQVPGKPGFVTSPYAPYSGYVDVRGFQNGTEVKDPYTGKIFLVP